MSNIYGNEQLRLARLEAICEQIQSEMDDVLESAYRQAVKEQNEERAAELARKIRNKMLELSDSEMSLDRIGLDTSSTIAFLSSLKNIFNNSWSVYRQHLRDITKQEGFPFNIDWGVAPNKEQK